MKKLIAHSVLTVLLFLFSVAAQAAQQEQIIVTVKGMVCSFCAQGIKKTFGKMEQIKSVDVDLEKKFVQLDLKEGTALSDDVIQANIKDAGFDVEKIERVKR